MTMQFSVSNRINPLGFRVMHKAISEKVNVGGQPRVPDLEELKKDGVKTVVTLWSRG